MMKHTPSPQRAFRLRLPPQHPISRDERRWSEAWLNDDRGTVPAVKLLADLLRRVAVAAMQDATECEPACLPAHQARLRDIESILACVTRHPGELSPAGDAALSGYQLSHPATLADFQAAVNVTRRTNRCPAFVNKWHQEFDALHQKLDSLARLVRLAAAHQVEVE